MRIEATCEENQTRGVKTVTRADSCETEKEGERMSVSWGETQSLRRIYLQSRKMFCLVYVTKRRRLVRKRRDKREDTIGRMKPWKLGRDDLDKEGATSRGPRPGEGR